MTSFKIGVLLPRSTIYPMMGNDLLNGLKAGLQEMGLGEVPLVFENVGFGGVDDEVYARTEKLLLQEEATLVIAFLDHFAALHIEPLFAGMNRLLLVIDTGGQVPTGAAPCAVRFTLSLQSALGSRFTGRMAVEQGCKRVIFATSFYEGGYLQCYAYQRGITESGGTICYHSIVPFHRESFKVATLCEAVQQHRPQAVVAQFSAEAGHIFLHEFIRTGLHEQVKLYASPLLLEEAWLAEQLFPFEGITGCISWSRQLPYSANRLLMETIQKMNKRLPTVFTMLGWEAAQFCTLVVPAWEKEGGNALAIAQQLEECRLNSPRGRITMEKSSHYFSAPIYAATVVPDDTTGCSKLSVQGEVGFAQEEYERFMTDQPEGVFSRWTNTYLCL